MKSWRHNSHVTDEELIELVKEHSLLYDPSHEKYSDSRAREEVWAIIGRALKKSPLLCKTRWTNLRDNYRKYLRKRLTNVHVTNRYDDLLGSFLKPCIKLSEEANDIMPFEVCNVETKEEALGDDEALNFGSFSEAFVNNDVNYGLHMNSGMHMNTGKRRYSEAFPPTSPNVAGETGVDPVDAFLAGIGATIKTFTPLQQNLIKSKIFAAVQEFELENVLNHTSVEQTNGGGDQVIT